MNESILDRIVACNKQKPFVFVSYSSADYEYVYEDVLAFQSRGYNIWLDEKNLDKTNDSWKDDALNAIRDIDCQLVLFYVSESSLTSANCLEELREMSSPATTSRRMGKPLKYVSIETGMVGIIDDFQADLYHRIKDSDLDKATINKKLEALSGFKTEFFSNNERGRILSRNNPNRKSDYYADVVRYFPPNTKNLPIKPKTNLDPELEQALRSGFDLEVEHMDQMYPDGNHYIGDSYKGMRHGNGKMIYATGEVFTGQWKLDIRTYGTQEWKEASESADTGKTIQLYRGHWANDLPNGSGIMTYENGDEYEGMFSNGLHDGQGKLTTKDGTIYEGAWVNGRRTGQGTILKKDGYHYEGGFLNDQKDGSGREIFANRDHFEGEYRNDLFNGDGVFNRADGSVYKGRFIQGKYHGPGTMTYADGTIYEGEWENGLQEGLGKTITANGDTHEGQYHLGRYHGKGTHVLADGSKYEGYFEAGLYSGAGTMCYANGDTYSGNWLYGMRDGNGTMIFANGDRYEGIFTSNVLSGKGTMRYANGEMYEGQWVNGRRHGQGKTTFVDQRIYEGRYSDDAINGKGRMTYLDGTEYNGDWFNGIRSGRGHLTFEDGRIYDGAFSNDRINGKGTMQYPDHSVYEGEWIEEIRTGNGIYTWPDGKRYTGTFMDDHITGHGSILWPAEAKGLKGFLSYDRDKYEGDVVDGLRCGNGIMQYANGQIYDGQWKDDQRSGHGKLITPVEETTKSSSFTKIGKGLLNRLGDSKLVTKTGITKKTSIGSVTIPENADIQEGEWKDDRLVEEIS